VHNYYSCLVLDNCHGDVVVYLALCSIVFELMKACVMVVLHTRSEFKAYPLKMYVGALSHVIIISRVLVSCYMHSCRSRTFSAVIRPRENTPTQSSTLASNRTR
jgi:hypothetical protein